jgi:3-methyladenine DNA glycosylase AlkC
MEGTVNEILQDISQLSADEQYYISETLNRRLNDIKRQQIAARRKEARQNYTNGKTTSGSVSDLIKLLDD